MAEDWPVVAPEEAGFAADLADRFSVARDAGLLPNVHGVIAARGGRIVFERYLDGIDHALARPLGPVRFAAETRHDLRSVSKSVVGLLYGIALRQGLVPPPAASLYAQFPKHADLARDPARADLTVGHALSMSLGLQWDELSLPYSDPRNSEIAMEAAPDRVRYVLERPVAERPGQRWTYMGGATALLADLLARGTGTGLEAYARTALFAPLGIGPTEWHRGRDGREMAASGLRMTPRDLLRIGVAVLGRGDWQGRSVIPADWIAAMTEPAVAMADGRRYGFQWYLGETPRAAGDAVRWERSWSAIGNGGQRLTLFPSLDLAVVVTAGNYDSADQWRPPMVALRDVILPALNA